MTQTARPALKILMLGATGNIGPYHVDAALQRGHQVSVFARGKTSANLPPEVEVLAGDREGDLTSIQDRDWDAVLDLATEKPAWVRTLGQALQGRVGHFTFISTLAVYDRADHFGQGTDEAAKLMTYDGSADPYSNDPSPQYGPLKALAEREAERWFPGNTLIIRPGCIVGPGDGVGAFTYWPVRMQRGGEVLVPGDPSMPVQLIDVRDMADWVIRLVESHDTGTYNTIGPESPATWGDLLDAIASIFPEPQKLVWVPMTWLAEQGAQPWTNLTFWPEEADLPGLMSTPNERAIRNGLTLRPIQETAADTLAWYTSQPPERTDAPLMTLTPETGLQDSMTYEQELLARWRTARGRSQ